MRTAHAKFSCRSSERRFALLLVSETLLSPPFFSVKEN